MLLYPEAWAIKVDSDGTGNGLGWGMSHETVGLSQADFDVDSMLLWSQQN